MFQTNCLSPPCSELSGRWPLVPLLPCPGPCPRPAASHQHQSWSSPFVCHELQVKTTVPAVTPTGLDLAPAALPRGLWSRALWSPCHTWNSSLSLECHSCLPWCFTKSHLPKGPSQALPHPPPALLFLLRAGHLHFQPIPVCLGVLERAHVGLSPQRRVSLFLCPSPSSCTCTLSLINKILGEIIN